MGFGPRRPPVCGRRLELKFCLTTDNDDLWLSLSPDFYNDNDNKLYFIVKIL